MKTFWGDASGSKALSCAAFRKVLRGGHPLTPLGGDSISPSNDKTV